MNYVRRFEEIGINDIPVVGGKNASLGEMIKHLTPKGINIPNGFATTAEAFRLYLSHNNLQERIKNALEKLDTHDTQALATTGARIRSWILHAELPKELADEFANAYLALENIYGESCDVAVRSSATAEDLPSASFAGQQETYLNIRGRKHLLITCKQVFASLFTDRAISYRVDQGFSHTDVALSIGVQKMIRADTGASGVIFTLDTETGFRDVVFITGAYGLGENIVQGQVNPDEFYVFKSTLATGHRPIIKRQLGEKEIKMVYGRDPLAGNSTRNVSVNQADRNRFCISDDDVLELARQAMIIEQHYSHPMDIEWAKDGETGTLYILQARPETVKSFSDSRYTEIYQLLSRGKVLTRGKSIGQKIATGTAHIILDSHDMHQLKPGEILVSDITDPDWEPVMKTAAAIVTNRGGRTCHAAIVARELGIPAIVGCNNATQIIETGQEITVSCAEGDTGLVYDGKQSFDQKQIQPDLQERPKTRMMLNLANPEQAFEASYLPSEGVGLARLEFIINNSIRIHPRTLIDYQNLDTQLRHRVDAIIAGYPSPKEFYINRLAEGVGMIAAAFYPRPVIVRMSDFKSNEYASLIGGERYEPSEENPMLGFRGASRYPSTEFAEAFMLECEAIKRARNDMGLNNIALMIPFVRSTEEAQKTLELMAAHGLKRSENGLHIYMMCEIPVNALLASEFIEYFDGFSIGSNDLTQLTLGVDRDSGVVQGFDERNEAVLKLMDMAIQTCLLNKKYIGICGQAPSDYPEIMRWLIERNINSISLNPDSIIRMSAIAVETEQSIEKEKSQKSDLKPGDRLS